MLNLLNGAQGSLILRFAMKSNIACIILCAGFSSRMQTNHKALLPIDTFSYVLEKIVKTFQDAEISQIVVVTGHNTDEITLLSRKLGCECVFNADFEKGMFSSVYAGISSLKAEVDATFLVPVDAALIRTNSVKRILEQREKCIAEKSNSQLIIPTFLDSFGHPPLIEASLFQEIVQAYKSSELSSNHQGLRGYFASLLDENAREAFLQGRNTHYRLTDNGCVTFLPIGDAGIISDIDTPEDYAQALEFLSRTENRKTPDISECFHLLLCADLPLRTKAHSFKVALGAHRLGLALTNSDAFDFDVRYCICGGLLHDICRAQKYHAQKGGELLKTYEWDIISSIVASHTNLPSELLEKIDIFVSEEKLHTEMVGDLVHNNNYLYPSICVYLADKYYSSDIHVTLLERHRLIMERYANNFKVLEAISVRQNVASEVEKFYHTQTGAEAYTCVELLTNHKYEAELLELIQKFNSALKDEKYE